MLRQKKVGCLSISRQALPSPLTCSCEAIANSSGMNRLVAFNGVSTLTKRHVPIHGTFETCRPILRMSVYRGRPEVTGPKVKTARLTLIGRLVDFGSHPIRILL
jgi:hypothetical protein